MLTVAYLRSTKTSLDEEQVDTTPALGMYFGQGPPNSMGVHLEPGEG